MLIYLVFFTTIFLVSNSRHLTLRLRTGTVVVLSFLFIGFRYETGFDWTAYKTQYDYILETGFFSVFELLGIQSLVASVERGFVLTTFFASRLFPAYEFVAALYTLVLLLSIVKLGSVLGVRNIGMALVFIHMPLLFTLEFSTVRQSLAIAMFNFGLAYYFEKRRGLSILFFSLSPLFQISGIMYLAVFFMAIGSRRASLPAFVGLIAVLFVFSMPAILLTIGSFLPPQVETKLEWYITERAMGGGLIDFGTAFFLLLPATLMTVNHLRKKGHPRDAVTIFRIAALMSAIALAFVSEQTIRNRFIYEIVILLSLLSFSRIYPIIPYMRMVLLSFGAIMLAVYLTQDSRIMYMPYQNFLIWKAFSIESSGQERASEYYTQKRLRLTARTDHSP
jgi:hypothetical protein